jgi:phosphoribosylformylglycinamidine synthase
MWQLSEAVDGMADACRAFGIPVVGGNVSLYNESKGADIDPTPVVGLLGLVDRLDRRPPGMALVEGGRLVVLGPPPQRELSGSRWARAKGHRGGALPALDFGVHEAVAGVVRELVRGGLVAGVHDVSQGGLGLALAEMAASSGVGLTVARVPDHVELFSESPSRVVACVEPELLAAVTNVCEAAGVAVTRLGVAGGDRFTVKDLVDVPLGEVVGTWRDRLPDALGHGTTQG